MVHISPYRATQRESSYPRRSPCRGPPGPPEPQPEPPRAAEPAHRHDPDAASRAFSPPGAQSAANTGLHSEIGPESWHAATGLAVVTVSGVRQTAHDRGVRPGCGAAQADTAARETPQVGGYLRKTETVPPGGMRRIQLGKHAPQPRRHSIGGHAQSIGHHCNGRLRPAAAATTPVHRDRSVCPGIAEDLKDDPP